MAHSVITGDGSKQCFVPFDSNPAVDIKLEVPALNASNASKAGFNGGLVQKYLFGVWKTVVPRLTSAYSMVKIHQ